MQLGFCFNKNEGKKLHEDLQKLTTEIIIYAQALELNVTKLILHKDEMILKSKEDIKLYLV